MSANPNKVLADAVLLALAKGYVTSMEHDLKVTICRAAAASAGDVDLALPLEMLLETHKTNAEAWAKRMIPGHSLGNAVLSSDGLSLLVQNEDAVRVVMATCEYGIGFGSKKPLSQDTALQNAKRLAAAWNVCQGVDQTTLDDMDESGMTIAELPQIQALIARNLGG